MNRLEQGFKRLTPLKDVTMIRSMCSLLEGLLDELNRANSDAVSSAPQARLSSATLEQIFVYSLVWACGGALVGDERAKFSSFVAEMTKDSVPHLSGLRSMFEFSPLMPGLSPWNDSAHAYNPRCQDLGLFSQVLSYVMAITSMYLQVFVHTEETARIQRVLRFVVKNQRHTALIGATGTGKTCLLNDFCASLSDVAFQFESTRFNAHTVCPLSVFKNN